MITLNLGCGHLNREEGEIGVDINPDCNPDVLASAENLPFDDEFFDNAKAVHVLEHVDNIVRVMDEVSRVCKKGARFHIRVPLFPTVGSVADPTHKRYFVPDTFRYFTEKGALSGLKNIWDLGGIKTTEQEIYVTLRKT